MAAASGQKAVREGVCMFVESCVANYHVLNPGEDGVKKAGLEGRIDVCIVVQETCECEHNTCRHARLVSVQTGKYLLIG